MNILTIADCFPNEQSCVEILERVKWQGVPRCPFYGSEDGERKRESELVGRWNCHNCLSSFKVTSGTMVQGTKISLRKWFIATAILQNAKKSVSSCQLARDLDINQKTAWCLAMRIRRAMKEQPGLLHGIVEADETYLGGKPRYPKPGRTGMAHQLPIIGAVERDGKVKAEPSPKVTTKLINAFLRRKIDPRSVLVTDMYPVYNEVRDWVRHLGINHSEGYVQDGIHTNTIEGF